MPSCTKRFAVDRPMPVEPPVITPTLPASLQRSLLFGIPSVCRPAWLRAASSGVVSVVVLIYFSSPSTNGANIESLLLLGDARVEPTSNQAGVSGRRLHVAIATP